MKLKSFLPLATISAGAVSAGAVSCGSHSASVSATRQHDHVNFILINLDDAGNGDFSFSGALGYQTPNIDRLACEGMRYTQFYAAQPISGASRAGLLTGCYPNRIGFAHAPSPGCPYGISDSEETIAEVLKKRNYATAIFGKWHLGDAENSCHFSTDSTSGTASPTRTTCGHTIHSGNSRTCPPTRGTGLSGTIWTQAG